MRLILVFEDNDDSITSKFIRNRYDNSEVIMAGGNYNVLEYFKVGSLKCIWNPDSVFVILLDVVPDNTETVDKLDKLEKLIYANGYTNVFIIPIPCIEYFFIKAFWSKDIEGVDTAVSRGIYWPLTGILKSGNVTSFEKYCKRITLVTNNKCKQISRFKFTEEGGRGRFYLQNCRCDNQAAQSHADWDLLDKVNTLTSELPMLPSNTEEGYRSMVYAMLRQLSDNAYNELEDQRILYNSTNVLKTF